MDIKSFNNFIDDLGMLKEKASAFVFAYDNAPFNIVLEKFEELVLTSGKTCAVFMNEAEKNRNF